MGVGGGLLKRKREAFCTARVGEPEQSELKIHIVSLVNDNPLLSVHAILRRMFPLAALFLFLSGFGYSQARASWDLEGLRATIVSDGLTSVESVLEKLPSEMRNHFVLGYRSQSASDASMEHPRVITYSPETKLILAFNGSPDQIGYWNLEAMQFRETTNTFDLMEIAFDKSGQAMPRFSDLNPSRCLACHGYANPHPIWEPYNQWPGFFGSDDDTLVVDGEWDGLGRFLKRAPTHGRYQYLDLSQVTPSLKGSSERIPNEPNISFTTFIQWLNLKRVAKEASLYPQAAAIKYAILGVPCSQPSAEGIDSSMFDGPRRLRDALSFDAFLPAGFEQLAEKSDAAPASLPAGSFSRTVRDFFSHLKIDISEWFISFERSENGRFGSLPNENETFVAAFALVDSDIARFASSAREVDYIRGSKSGYANVDCEALAVKSKEALMAFPREYIFQPQAASSHPPVAVSKCVKCHGQHDQEAPFIPFHDRVLMTDYVKSHRKIVDEIVSLNNKGGKVMPPVGSGFALPENQKKMLIDYVRELSVQ